MWPTEYKKQIIQINIVNLAVGEPAGIAIIRVKNTRELGPFSFHYIYVQRVQIKVVLLLLLLALKIQNGTTPLPQTEECNSN